MISNTLRIIPVVVLGITLCGCELLRDHPYEVSASGRRDINASGCALIEQRCAGRDTLRFAAIGDTQGWYDDTRHLVASINALPQPVDFVVHDGDLSDYGAAQEFEWQRDVLDGLAAPYVTVIGNHDCLGTGQQSYRAIFGESNYAFVAGRVKFVMLNTNALEYDYSVPVPDLDFIESEATARAEEFDRSVVVMHARPGSDVFNNNVRKAFQAYLCLLPGLMLCINGHDHTPSVDDLYGDGILYWQTANAARRQYYVFTITPDGYDCETIEY